LKVARSYAGPIDLMVSDVVMPHMGGVQVAEQLAAERPGMKVLFMSGYAESTVLRHGVIDVRNCFLQKPFALKALARKIREILEPVKTQARAAACP
jgi:DNA-binding NtrC family response regulator